MTITALSLAGFMTYSGGVIAKSLVRSPFSFSIQDWMRNVASGWVFLTCIMAWLVALE